MNLITAEPRSHRYFIRVDGEAVEYKSRWNDALKRGAVIAKTWLRAEKIEIIDSWGQHSKITYR